MEVVVTTGLLEQSVVQSSSQIITTNKPTSSFLQAGCPSCRPTNSVKALKGKIAYIILTSRTKTVWLLTKTNVNRVLIPQFIPATHVNTVPGFQNCIEWRNFALICLITFPLYSVSGKQQTFCDWNLCHNLHKQEAQLLLTKCTMYLGNMQWRVRLPNAHPFPYVLPCIMWSF